jgi:hypothetical protein
VEEQQLLVLVVALAVLEHPLELLVAVLLLKQNYLLTPLFLIPLLLVLVVMALLVQRKLAIQMAVIHPFQPLHQRVVEQVVLTDQLAQLVVLVALVVIKAVFLLLLVLVQPTKALLVAQVAEVQVTAQAVAVVLER